MINLDIDANGIVNPENISSVSRLIETVANVASVFQIGNIRASQARAHEKILSDVAADSSTPIEKRIAFVSNYDRIVKEERKKRKILEDAIPHIKQDSHPEDIDEDWLVDFFDKAGKISSEQLAPIWSRILAEESNDPGKVPRSLLHSLFIMERKDAESFKNLSRFCFFQMDQSHSVHPIIFMGRLADTNFRQGITDSSLDDIRRLGLIDVDYTIGYAINGPARFRYGNAIIEVNSPTINLGCVRFSRSGRVLFDMVEHTSNDGIREHVCTVFRRNGYDVGIIRR